MLRTCPTYPIGSRLTIMLGKGNGTFENPEQVSFPSNLEALTVQAGDVNGDGKLDLVIGGEDLNGGGFIHVMLSKGDGTFQAGALYSVRDPVLTTPDQVVIGDLNGDDNADLIVDQFNSSSILVFAGDGLGGFQQTGEIDHGFDTGGLPDIAEIIIGEFNRDGKPDLLVGDGLFAKILLGNGDGTFQSGQAISADWFPALVSDLNGDGNADIVGVSGTNSNNRSITVLLGNGNGTFQPEVKYPLPQSIVPKPLATLTVTVSRM
jgi:hypothetical protein